MDALPPYKSFCLDWRQSITPLQIRRSLRLLFSGTEKPFRHILELIWIWPWKLKVPLPCPSPATLFANPDLIWERYDGITVRRRIPLFYLRDTPTRSVYRMCEFICANQTNQLMLEFQYFWFHPCADRWTVDSIPDPIDELDPERIAILASLIECLTVAFKFRFSYGFQRSERPEHSGYHQHLATNPAWTARVPPLPFHLVLTHALGEANPGNPFKNRNITVNEGNLYNI